MTPLEKLAETRPDVPHLSTSLPMFSRAAGSTEVVPTMMFAPVLGTSATVFEAAAGDVRST